MLHTGLASVTFRALTPDEIIRLAKTAGLEGIEWGGDVHVPPGDLQRAQEVYSKTLEAGLRVTSYGSYYTAGSTTQPHRFEDVLETALALHAPVIRVWAGKQGSQEASADVWQAVIADTARIVQLAAQKNAVVAFEYHENSLTDTPESTLRLIGAVNHQNLKCYWQRLDDLLVDQYTQQLNEVSPWLSNVHVFQEHNTDRRPLAEGYTAWRRLLQFVNKLPGDRYCLLEFVRDDAPEQFIKDAQTLNRLLAEIQGNSSVH
jgi:3-dehydroshikimate dehydratase